MFYVNLIIVILYIMLAILSRQHYSKYKGNKSVKDKIKSLGMAMGTTIYDMTEKIINKKDINDSLRKVNVVSSKGIEYLSKKYVVESIGVILGVFFLFNLITGIVSIEDMRTARTDENIIEREDYSDGEKEHTIMLELNGESYEYSLNVAPVEYTEDEFMAEAEKVFSWLEGAILGENPDLEHISKNLTLPYKDENNIFYITWSTENPMLIDSNGCLFHENINTGDVCCITAKVEYLDYSVCHEFKLILESVENDENIVTEAGNIILDVEESSRTQKYFELPADIKGVKVKLKQENDNLNIKVFILGVIISIFVSFIRKEKLKNAEKYRDNVLQRKYSAFVSKLWLLMGTGMTVKAAFAYIVKTGQYKGVLSKEIEYSLNQIASGMDETAVYEELGMRLALPEYNRLMSQIAHNLRRGNYDLLEFMEKEVKRAFEIRKELARKFGEEASTKLLFPMIILLVIVMVIVIVPGIFSF